jgi:Asp-tRNA(Asn)/Glu-tRNA(Gln) amidotransferase C subunit
LFEEVEEVEELFEEVEEVEELFEEVEEVEEEQKKYMDHIMRGLYY